jgi:hypothetical protein
MTPTLCPGPTDGKLGGMEFRTDRFVFGLLVLVLCGIATWRGPDRTPSEEVVELVSVVYRPARPTAYEPVPVETKAAGESANAQSATPARETSTDHIASSKRPLQEHASPPGQRAKEVPRQGSATVRSARASMGDSNAAKVSCRPSACRARATATNAVTKHAAARQGRKPEPPLPAVFMPIRKLGLYLQARLGTPQHGKAAGERKR